METSIIIIIIGLFIFCGHYLSGVFERRSIPDVLGLMIIGMILGPITGIVDPASFGQFGSLFSNLVLIFILFESGTELRIEEVKSSFRESFGVTVLGFVSTAVVVFVLCKWLFYLPTLTCLFIGCTLGGTSSAVVVGLVKKLTVKPRTSTALIMESAETDVFTLAIPLSILGVMTTGLIQTSVVISSFVSSLIMALLIGIGGAFVWSFILGKIPTLKQTKFTTPAFLFILYGVAEYLKFSGPLTALSFGIAIGNLHYLEPKLLSRFVPNKSIVLPASEKDFFSELVFLLRTFFFVFIGISIQINRVDGLLWGALITAVLFVVRILVVRIAVSRQLPLLDKITFAIMIPKGLGAAVIATLPLQLGVPHGEIIQSICFAVILFSTLYCVGLFFLVKTGKLNSIYGWFFPEPRNVPPHDPK